MLWFIEKLCQLRIPDILIGLLLVVDLVLVATVAFQSHVCIASVRCR